MIERAEKLGFEEIGVSNHLIYHSNMPIDEDMFLDDYQKLRIYVRETFILFAKKQINWQDKRSCILKRLL